MAFRIIKPEDDLDVQFAPLLLYGPPSSGKSTLAQTANNPFTLDLDDGIHRVAKGVRKDAVRFDTWDDVTEATMSGLFDPYATIVVDTGGRCLDALMTKVMKQAGKSSMTQPLWGQVGSNFKSWLTLLRSLKKDLVMLCHLAEKSKDEQTIFKPDLPGNMAWDEIHKCFDLVAEIVNTDQKETYFEGYRRFLDFSPCLSAPRRKNAAQFRPIQIPDLHANPHFLANLIADAKLRIGKTAQDSALIVKTVGEWKGWLATDPNLDSFNAKLPEVAALPKAAKAQVAHLLNAHIQACGWKLDKERKVYFRPAGDPSVDEPVPVGVNGEAH